MSIDPPIFKTAVQRLEDLGGHVLAIGHRSLARLKLPGEDILQGTGLSHESAAKDLLEKLDKP